MVLDLLTNEDKEKINLWRDFILDSRYPHANLCEVDFLLRYWDNAKSNSPLGQMFADSLIKSYPVEYAESEAQLYNRIDDLLTVDTRCHLFKYALIEYLYQHCHYALSSVLSNSTLAHNKIEVCNTEVYEINGTTIKLHNGEKPMKVIRQIAQATGIGIEIAENDISDFEYFRQKISLCLNQKKCTGTLNLSIHPLDYMTMSDNDSGWSSCMRWRNMGEYRQGTVEMMNSPYVVVGYLSADEPFQEWKFTWNNKKWRCLFIVDDEYIISIKSYPFFNQFLTKECVRHLAELRGWNSAPITEIHNYYSSMDLTVNDITLDLNFYTSGCMYNDFGSTDHYLCINPDFTEETINADIDYCGESECMVCGMSDYTTIGPDNHPAALACTDCMPGGYCTSCEEYREGEEFQRTADGYWLCSNCFEQYTVYDEYSNEYYSNNEDILTFQLCDDNWNVLTTITTTETSYNDEICHYLNIDVCYESRYNQYDIMISECPKEALDRLFHYEP